MSVRTNIANGLKKARKDKGLTVSEVGKFVKRSGKTISAWEVGRGQPDSDQLIVLCRALDIDFSDLYGAEYADVILGQDLDSSGLSPNEINLIMAVREKGGEIGLVSFSQREMNLIEKYRSLSDSCKAVVDDVLNSILEHMDAD